MRKLAPADMLVGVVGGSIDLVGITGNIILLLVLVTRQTDKPMYIILQTMSVANLVILSLNAAFQALPIICHLTDSMIQWYNFAYLHGIYFWVTAMAAHHVKVWLTVLLSVERWMAVCRPLQFKTSFLKSRVRYVIGFVCITSVVFTIPRFLERECVQSNSSSVANTNASAAYLINSNSNGVNNNNNQLKNDKNKMYNFNLCDWQATDDAKAGLYAYGYGVVAYALFVFLLPVGTVLVLNGHIIYELRRDELAELSIIQKYERRISKVPLAIAVLFCVLQTPAMLINVFEFGGFAETQRVHKNLWRAILAITTILILIDSAADGIVYFYNLNCSMRAFQQAIFGSRGDSRRSLGRQLRTITSSSTSNDVRLNEVTKKKIIISYSNSQRHLTVKENEVTHSEQFSFMA